MKKKFLFVLDMDSTLLSDDARNTGILGKPDDITRIHGATIPVYKRPYMHEFLDFLFANFTDVAIWTAADSSWLNVNLNGVLRPYKNKFLFTWDRSMLDTNVSYPFYSKPLEKIWDKYPEYNKSNTLIIDDTKNITKTNNDNHILISKFLPKKENKFDMTFLNMINELNLRMILNYQPINEIATRSF